MKIIVYACFGLVSLVVVPLVLHILRTAWVEVVDYWKLVRRTLSRREIRKIKAEITGVEFIEVKETLYAEPVEEIHFIEVTVQMN